MSRRFGLPLALAALIGLAAGVGLSYKAHRAGSPTSPSQAVQVLVPVPRAESVPPPQARPTPAAPEQTGPRVAIVFDDAGGSLADVEKIIAIGRPVTVAVLPGLAHSSEVARRAVVAGLEVILHLPLEPLDGAKALGPGGVTTAMTDQEIRDVVRANLSSVPGVRGINNHMGSRGTADRRIMRAVLEVVRERGLFFVDSRTTPDTIAESLAGEMGVRTAARTIFLDNTDEEEAIRQEVQRLIGLARARGEAIAIGHAQRLTPRVIAEMRGEFDRQGVTLVPLSALVR